MTASRLLPGGSASSALSWAGRRLLLMAVVVCGAATAAFGALEFSTDDPARAVLGTTPQTPELLAKVRAELGLDLPAWQRYLDTLGRVLTGQFGRSYQLQEPVWSLIGQQAGSSVELVVAGLGLALVLAVVAAVVTAGGRRPALRGVLSTVELVTVSSPAFWVGIALLSVFSFRAQLFPVAGGSGLRGLVLPAVTMALGVFGTFAQVLRASLESALREPFALTATARGTAPTRLLVRHALRHALPPFVTLSGWTVGALLSGAVVIETVFSRPGLGRMLSTAIAGHDVPVVTGIVTLSAVAFSLISMVVDWLYGVVDVRLDEAAVR